MMVRLVGPEEIDAALSVLLGHNGRRAEASVVRDFARFAFQRRLNLRQIVVAEEGDRLVAAVMAVPSPGRTALVLTSSVGTSRTLANAVARCVDAVCDALSPAEVRLAQFLLEPADYRVADALRSVGCVDLTTLIYLQRALSRVPEPTLPDGCAVLAYSADTHAAFASTIEATYEDSLDCPALHGKRSIEDIVQGHKGAGEFNPSLWLCLTDHGRPVGVLLLAIVTGHSTMELVYTGLAPAARGKRFGDFLVQYAMHRASVAGMDQLTLAVDENNGPALRLYYRHGLGEVHRRLAMMRTIE